MSFGLLLLRVVVGGTIAVHGAQKLFGVFNGPGIKGFAQMNEKMRLKPGRPFAMLAGTAEFGGGTLLVLGLITPLGAVAVAGTMIGAIALVHLRNGFFNTDGGIEFPMLLGTTALSLAFTGPGSASLDAALGLELNGITWGLVAMALAAISASIMLASRTEEPAPDEAATQERHAA